MKYLELPWMPLDSCQFLSKVSCPNLFCYSDNSDFGQYCIFYLWIFSNKFSKKQLGHVPVLERVSFKVFEMMILPEWFSYKCLCLYCSLDQFIKVSSC